MSDGFDFEDFTEFEKDLLKTASDLKNGKYTKQFLRKEGTKLNKENKKQAANINDRTGNFKKGFKRGKVYKNDGDLKIRAFNSSRHAHLVNNGHRIVTKSGQEKGFKEGEHFMEKATQNFEREFADDVKDFLDDMLDNHDL